MRVIKNIIFATTFLIIISCTQNPEESILGKWELNRESNGARIFYEFKENNNLIVSMPPETLTASWYLKDDGIFIPSSGKGDKDITLPYRFTGKNSLEITDTDGQIMKFTKMDLSSESTDSNGVVGEYACQSPVYSSIYLSESGKAYIRMSGMEIPGTYEVDGNKVLLSYRDKGIVFTNNNGILDGGSIAGICSKV